MSSYFVYEYTCQTSIDTLTIDIDMPITVTQFSDSTCTTPKKHWAYYSPECHDSDITTDSYHVTCSADDSYADVQVYSCDADTLDGCRGSCSYFSEEVDATRWSGYADGCFWDYDSSSYVTVECAPANPKWQAVYSFPGPNVVGMFRVVTRHRIFISLKKRAPCTGPPSTLCFGYADYVSQKRRVTR
ncbi:hypothetical protein Pelo_19528 [Pelomyxa schiedti]|nr:hypothetical protein Pelo_19528 [Pelomyxa schiedti]